LNFHRVAIGISLWETVDMTKSTSFNVGDLVVLPKEKGIVFQVIDWVTFSTVNEVEGVYSLAKPQPFNPGYYTILYVGKSGNKGSLVCHVSCVSPLRRTIAASALGGSYVSTSRAGNTYRTHLSGSHGPQDAARDQKNPSAKA
jgi:hypothetical protein